MDSYNQWRWAKYTLHELSKKELSESRFMECIKSTILWFSLSKPIFFFKLHYSIISSKGLSTLGFRSRHFGRWGGNSHHNINLDCSFFFLNSESMQTLYFTIKYSELFFLQPEL